MAVVWKVNGSTPDALGIERLQLQLVNLGMDKLGFNQPGAFDGAPAFDPDDEIVLTVTVDAGDPVCKFRGRVREVPRRSTSTEERIGFEAWGAWDELMAYAFLQNFKEATDPEDPESSLGNVLRGRIIISQDDTGAKINIGAFVTAVIEFAAASGANIAVGDIDLSMIVPWDESTDMQCSDALLRALQLAPSAVGWWDYSVNPPEFNLQRRELGLTAVNLAVKPAESEDDDEAYAPLDQVLINPRHDLVSGNVCLIYLRTNRENEATWETTERDIYPPGTTGRERNAMVRTIQLAGSVYNSTVLQQKVTSDAIPSSLEFSGALLPAGGTFAAVLAWWKKHVPWLKLANVTILGFQDGARTTEEGAAVDEELERELISGAITDWMEDFQGISAERQRVTVQVLVEIEDPVTTKVERVTHQIEALIQATNAQTRTYSFLQDEEFTPAEEAPEGLAEAIHGAVSNLQYDGTIVAVEKEATLLASIGNLLNLTDSLEEWEAMNALIQQVLVDLDSGQTTFVVGPPKHLGPADLVELYRANRTRQPVTSHLVRTGGRRITTDTAQGLAIHMPIKPGSAALPNATRVFAKSIAPAGETPTSAEVAAALAAVFGSGGEGENSSPRTGDTVNLVKDDAIIQRVQITSTDPRPGATDTPNEVEFSVGSANYYGMVQKGTGSGGGGSFRVFDATFTVAGTVVVISELATAIEGLFDDDTPPAEGDVVNLFKSGDAKVKFRAQLTQTDPGGVDDSLFNIELGITIDEVEQTWYAMIVQTGLY